MLDMDDVEAVGEEWLPRRVVMQLERAQEVVVLDACDRADWALLPPRVRATLTLVAAGFELRELAQRVGMSEDDFHESLNRDMGLIPERICEVCGVVLPETKRRHARTCSSRCRVALSRRQR